MNNIGELEVTERTPLMLRRLERKPQVSHPMASHFTYVTTNLGGGDVGDQMEDAFR